MFPDDDFFKEHNKSMERAKKAGMLCVILFFVFLFLSIVGGVVFIKGCSNHIEKNGGVGQIVGEEVNKFEKAKDKH